MLQNFTSNFADRPYHIIVLKVEQWSIFGCLHVEENSHCCFCSSLQNRVDYRHSQVKLLGFSARQLWINLFLLSATVCCCGNVAVAKLISTTVFNPSCFICDLLQISQ